MWGTLIQAILRRQNVLASEAVATEQVEGETDPTASSGEPDEGEEEDASAEASDEESAEEESEDDSGSETSEEDDGDDGDADSSDDGGSAEADGDDGSNPLLEAMDDGAEAGDSLGPASALADSPPAGGLVPAEGLPQGPLASQLTPVPVPDPTVGGVLFDQRASLPAALGEIRGAYFDEATSTVVLIGELETDGATPTEHRLPELDRDHLIVALKAYASGQPLGVSIDPPAAYRDGSRRGQTPPDGEPMLVSYLGCEGTMAGATVFESDRILKILTTGCDNITRETVHVPIGGFEPLIEMLDPEVPVDAGNWHRFWFVIDSVELKVDEASSAMTYGDIKIKVLTETEKDCAPVATDADCPDKRFAEHITRNFDQYAEVFPIFTRLRELAKVSALAKFLVSRDGLFDWGTLLTTPTQPVATPDTTPGFSVTGNHEHSWREGNATHTRRVSIYGGVDMNPGVCPVAADAATPRLRQEAERSRPNEATFGWSFDSGGCRMAARVLRLDRDLRAHRPSVVDHEFADAPRADLLRVERTQEPTARGDFGPGWALWTPFSLKVIEPHGKRAEVLTEREKTREDGHTLLILQDNTYFSNDIYRQTARKGSRRTFCRVISQKMEGEACSFSYDPEDTIVMDRSGFHLDKNGRGCSFDSEGRLLKVTESRREVVRYHRKNGVVQKISGADGKRYRIRHDKSGSGRIREIEAADGAKLQYVYADDGRLESCRVNS